MPCFRPVQAVRFPTANRCCTELFHAESGKAVLFFGKRIPEMIERFGEFHELLALPCGKCIGCLNRRASDWGIRCYHESMFWEDCSFITLTYATEYLPANRSLRKSDLQKFWKRLRIELLRRHNVQSVRYFACGEYGEERGRPHYHALLFGWSFPDRVRTEQNPGAVDALYESEFLTKVWGLGKATLGIAVGGRSATYVAKYSLKKLHGEKGARVYGGSGRIPPFTCMSHGIGSRWFHKYKGDLYPSDFVVNEDGSKRLAVPRRYDVLLSQISEEYLEWIKLKRVANRKFNPADETLERIAVRELCAIAASTAASERRLEHRVSCRESQNGTA